MELTLKQARRLAEKTQQEVADHIGVCVDTYRALELRPDNATIKQAKLIADFLHVSYNQIFFGDKST